MSSKVIQKGNDNLSILESQVTIEVYENFNQLNKLLSMGKTAEAALLYKSILNSASAQHPLYPDWRYELTQSESGVSIRHVPNNDDSLKKHPMHGKMKITIPQEYTKFDNFNELLQHSYFTQTPLNFNAEYIKMWIGDYLLDDFDESNGTVSVLLEPQKFPPPFKAKLYFNDSSLSFDYLEMGLTKIENNQLFINNSKQANSKFTFELIFDMIRETGKFNISINENYKRNVRANIDFITFMSNIDKNIGFKVKELETDSIFVDVIKCNIDNSDSLHPDYIEFLQLLERMERYFNVSFILPEEEINEDENEALIILNSIMEDSFLNGSYEFFAFDVENKTDLIKYIELFKNGTPVDLEIRYYDFNISVFGANILISEHHRRFCNSMLKDYRKLENKINLFDEGDSIKLKFEPLGEPKYTDKYIFK